MDGHGLDACFHIGTISDRDTARAFILQYSIQHRVFYEIFIHC